MPLRGLGLEHTFRITIHVHVALVSHRVFASGELMAGGTRLFVGNLPPEVNDEQLQYVPIPVTDDGMRA